MSEGGVKMSKEEELEEIQNVLKQLDKAKHAHELLRGDSNLKWEQREQLRRDLYGEDDGTKRADALKASLSKKFDQFSGEDSSMDVNEFSKALGMKAGKPDEVTLASKIFQKMQKENNTHINKEMFIDTIAMLNTGSFDQRMLVAFEIFDTDKNGEISEHEFMAFLKCSLLENRLKTSQFDDDKDTQLTAVVTELFKNKEKEGAISLEEFKSLLLKSELGDGLKLSGLDARSSRVLDKYKIPDPGKIRRFFINNHKRIVLFILSLALNTWSFVYKWCENNTGAKFELMGWGLPLAKGCAEVMKVTFVFLMIFMCRGFITMWRSSWVGKYMIEFDDAIMNHKLNAQLFFVAMWVHVIAHVVNVENWINPSNYNEWRAAFPDEGTTQPSRFDVYTSSIALTGLALTIGFNIVFLFALEWPRNASCLKDTAFGKFANNFNVFWTTHHLVFICFIFLAVHPYPGLCWDPCEADATFHGDTWQWMLLPVLIYGAERLRRHWKQMSSGFQPAVLLAQIKKGSDKPVLQLRMTKPDSWRSGPKKAESGMYCFVKCVDISGYEWHPFTLTSAPHEDFVEVHIRGLGDWTAELCKRFEAVNDSQDRTVDSSDERSAESLLAIPRYPVMALEGPYGAPAQGYDRFKVLLLVGGGIGVTPFISILKDIWNKMDQRRCPTEGCDKVNLKNFELKKAYFNYMSRDQASMAWFTDTITPIVQDDTEKIIECHQHLTSVKEDGDVRSAAITIAQSTSIGMDRDDVEDASSFAGKDIVTGARSNIPVHFGRPNWDKIFQYIQRKHPLEEVGVFFCGPPVIAAQLEACSDKYTEPNNTQFFYYEEHF